MASNTTVTLEIYEQQISITFDSEVISIGKISRKIESETAGVVGLLPFDRMQITMKYVQLIEDMITSNYTIVAKIKKGGKDIFAGFIDKSTIKFPIVHYTTQITKETISFEVYDYLARLTQNDITTSYNLGYLIDSEDHAGTDRYTPITANGSDIIVTLPTTTTGQFIQVGDIIETPKIKILVLATTYYYDYDANNNPVARRCDITYYSADPIPTGYSEITNQVIIKRFEGLSVTISGSDYDSTVSTLSVVKSILKRNWIRSNVSYNTADDKQVPIIFLYNWYIANTPAVDVIKSLLVATGATVWTTPTGDFSIAKKFNSSTTKSISTAGLKNVKLGIWDKIIDSIKVTSNYVYSVKTFTARVAYGASTTLEEDKLKEKDRVEIYSGSTYMGTAEIVTADLVQYNNTWAGWITLKTIDGTFLTLQSGWVLKCKPYDYTITNVNNNGFATKVETQTLAEEVTINYSQTAKNTYETAIYTDANGSKQATTNANTIINQIKTYYSAIRTTLELNVGVLQDIDIGDVITFDGQSYYVTNVEMDIISNTATYKCVNTTGQPLQIQNIVVPKLNTNQITATTTGNSSITSSPNSYLWSGDGTVLDAVKGRLSLGFTVSIDTINRLTNAVIDNSHAHSNKAYLDTIAGNTLVANLNADMLDGKHASDFVAKTGDTMTNVLSINTGTPFTTAVYGFVPFSYDYKPNTVYRKLATLPINNPSNLACLQISGLISGWVVEQGKAIINIVISNRSGLVFDGGYHGILGHCDIVVYQNTDNTVSVYAKFMWGSWCANWLLDMKGTQVTWDYITSTETTTAPSGTLVKSLSTDLGKIWHSNNDGSGSGLDADLLDGLDSSRFHRSALSEFSGGDWNTLTSHGVYNIQHASFASDTNNPPANYPYGILNVLVSEIGVENRTLQIYYPHDWDNYIYLRMYNGGDWKAWRKIWANGTGSGSGLDADLLDGYHASAFPRLDAMNTFTGQNIFTNRNTYFGTNGIDDWFGQVIKGYNANMVLRWYGGTKEFNITTGDGVADNIGIYGTVNVNITGKLGVNTYPTEAIDAIGNIRTSGYIYHSLTDYVAQGFKLEASKQWFSKIEAENLVVKRFTTELEQIYAGLLTVGESAGKTTVAQTIEWNIKRIAMLDGTTSAQFAVDDIIMFQYYNRSGGGITVLREYFRVTGVATNTAAGVTDYTVTRLTSNIPNGTSIPAGSVVIKVANYNGTISSTVTLDAIKGSIDISSVRWDNGFTKDIIFKAGDLAGLVFDGTALTGKGLYIAGNAYITAKINATEGKIGGWGVDDQNIYYRELLDSSGGFEAYLETKLTITDGGRFQVSYVEFEGGGLANIVNLIQVGANIWGSGSNGIGVKNMSGETLLQILDSGQSYIAGFKFDSGKLWSGKGNFGNFDTPIWLNSVTSGNIFSVTDMFKVVRGSSLDDNRYVQIGKDDYCLKVSTNFVDGTSIKLINGNGRITLKPHYDINWGYYLELSGENVHTSCGIYVDRIYLHSDGNYYSSSGNAGLSGQWTVKDGSGNNKTFVFQNGLLVDVT
jgi:hypothetical protein